MAFERPSTCSARSDRPGGSQEIRAALRLLPRHVLHDASSVRPEPATHGSRKEGLRSPGKAARGAALLPSARITQDSRFVCALAYKSTCREAARKSAKALL